MVETIFSSKKLSVQERLPNAITEHNIYFFIIYISIFNN